MIFCLLATNSNKKKHPRKLVTCKHVKYKIILNFVKKHENISMAPVQIKFRTIGLEQLYRSSPSHYRG